MFFYFVVFVNQFFLIENIQKEITFHRDFRRGGDSHVSHTGEKMFFCISNNILSLFSMLLGIPALSYMTILMSFAQLYHGGFVALKEKNLQSLYTKILQKVSALEKPLVILFYLSFFVALYLKNFVFLSSGIVALVFHYIDYTAEYRQKYGYFTEKARNLASLFLPLSLFFSLKIGILKAIMAPSALLRAFQILTLGRKNINRKSQDYLLIPEENSKPTVEEIFESNKDVQIQDLEFTNIVSEVKLEYTLHTNDHEHHHDCDHHDSHCHDHQEARDFEAVFLNSFDALSEQEQKKILDDFFLYDTYNEHLAINQSVIIDNEYNINYIKEKAKKVSIRIKNKDFSNLTEDKKTELTKAIEDFINEENPSIDKLVYLAHEGESCSIKLHEMMVDKPNPDFSKEMIARIAAVNAEKSYPAIQGFYNKTYSFFVGEKASEIVTQSKDWDNRHIRNEWLSNFMYFFGVKNAHTISSDLHVQSGLSSIPDIFAHLFLDRQSLINYVTKQYQYSDFISDSKKEYIKEKFIESLEKDAYSEDEIYLANQKFYDDTNGSAYRSALIYLLVKNGFVFADSEKIVPKCSIIDWFLGREQPIKSGYHPKYKARINKENPALTLRLLESRPTCIL